MCSLTLLGKIEEDIATIPPIKKIIPELRSRIKEKNPSSTNMKMVTLRNMDKNSSNKRSIAKKMKLTLKTQIKAGRQF
jgi:hypothetical protein